VEDELQELGTATVTLPLSVLGLKDGAVWLVQAVTAERMIDSAVVEGLPESRRLVRGAVFENSILEERHRETLRRARYILQKAFPSLEIFTFVLVMHPQLPDFELYHVDTKAKEVRLTESLIRTNSIDFKEKLREDHQSLWTLAHRFDDELFRGVPPCRGGRTLGLLASAATRQLRTDKLLTWKERQFIQMLKEDFDYDIPRDKIRHDLGDRLVGQGFVRKRGSQHFMTIKGMARYQYCLAKYTTKGTENPMAVLDICTTQRNKIVERYGCL